MIPPFEKRAKYRPSTAFPEGYESLYVTSQAEEDALGPEWVNTPADLPKPKVIVAEDVEANVPAQPAPKGGDQPAIDRDPWTSRKRSAK